MLVLIVNFSSATDFLAHPYTLSYVEVVFKDEITDPDRAGKETTAEGRRSSAILSGNKTKAFNARISRQGMVKAPASLSCSQGVASCPSIGNEHLVSL